MDLERIGLTHEEYESCQRIEPEIFFEELLKLGLSEKNAKSALKLLARLSSDPFLFASKNRGTVKASVTYAVCVYLYLNHSIEIEGSTVPSQVELMRLFAINNAMSSSGKLKKLWPGFTPNIRQLFHEVVEQHKEVFPEIMEGKWPEWIDKTTFHDNKWIHHEI